MKYMNKLIAVIIVLSFQLPFAVYAQDPTNKEECISMLREQLQIQCTVLFGEDKADHRKACLDNIEAESEKQCDKFFGSGDFCSTCTSACIDQYKETDPTRVECLQTCFKNPACKKM